MRSLYRQRPAPGVQVVAPLAVWLPRVLLRVALSHYSRMMSWPMSNELMRFSVAAVATPMSRSGSQFKAIYRPRKNPQPWHRLQILTNSGCDCSSTRSRTVGFTAVGNFDRHLERMICAVDTSTAVRVRTQCRQNADSRLRVRETRRKFRDLLRNHCISASR